jgi:hypothetical protein
MTSKCGGDEITVGDIQNAQGIAIGRQAQARVDGHVTSVPQAVEAEAVRTALKVLRTALDTAGLAEDMAIRAQTAAGNALVEGVQDGQVQPESLVHHVRKVAETLKQANVAVDEGSSLWKSVQSLAPVLGPLVVGGAPAVAAWFGVQLPF